MLNSLEKNERITLTKRRIAKTLYVLITESSYDEITIYQILEKANVSRRTFYRYFDGKNDLMDYCLDIFIDEYYHRRNQFLKATSPEEVFDVTLCFMYDNHDFLRSLIASKHYYLFVRKFNINASNIFEEFNLPWNNIEHIPSKSSKYISRGLIGAYLNIILYWLAEDYPVEPKIITKDMTRLFSAIPLYFPDYLYEMVEKEQFRFGIMEAPSEYNKKIR